MSNKSPDAFRTISEVAEWLGVPTHVLRFWESRFTQVKPVKRAGGRRYYRPADMELLGGIRKLLHEDGMTIRGVQKILREEGIKHVSALSPGLDSQAMKDVSPSNVVSLDAGKKADAAPKPEPEPTPKTKPEALIEDAEELPVSAAPVAPEPDMVAPAPEITPEIAAAPEEPTIEPATDSQGEPDIPDSPEALDPLAHDAKIAPADNLPEMQADTAETSPEPEPPAQPADIIDISHIPDDPPEDGGSVTPDQSISLLASLRNMPDPSEAASFDATEIRPLIDRLNALKDRMSHESQARPKL